MKKVRVLCDPMLAIMAAIYTSVNPLYFVVMGIATYHNYPENFDEIIGWSLIWLIGIANSVLCIYCSQRWFAYVELNEEGILLCTIFKKTSLERYDQFPYFQIAHYKHFFTKRFFIVVTKKALSPTDLLKINKIRNSENCVKISISKKRALKLIEFFPDKQKEKLKKAISGEFDSMIWDLDKYKAKQKQISKARNTKLKREK